MEHQIRYTIFKIDWSIEPSAEELIAYHLMFHQMVPGAGLEPARSQ